MLVHPIFWALNRKVTSFWIARGDKLYTGEKSVTGPLLSYFLNRDGHSLGRSGSDCTPISLNFMRLFLIQVTLPIVSRR